MTKHAFSWADAQRRLRERLECGKNPFGPSPARTKPPVVKRAPSARVRRNRVRIGLPEVD